MEVDKEDNTSTLETPDGGDCSMENMPIDESADKVESSAKKAEEQNLSKIEDELLNNSLDLETEIKTFLGVSLESDESVLEEDIEKELLAEENEEENAAESKTVDEQATAAEKISPDEVYKECEDVIPNAGNLKSKNDGTPEAALSKETTIATVSTRIDQIVAEEFGEDENSFSGVTDIVQNILSNKFSDIENKLKEVTASEMEADSEMADVDSKTGDVDSKMTEVDSKTPEVDPKLPEIDPKTPDVVSKTADVDANTPEVDSKMPEVDSEIPDTDSKMPEVDSKSPEVDPKSPEVDPKTPDVDSKTADVDSNTPVVDSKTLEDDFETPDIDSKMAEVDSKTPDIDSKMADVDSKIPDVDSKTTDVDSKMPDVDSKATDVDSEMTDVDSKMPDVGSKVTDVDSKSSDVETKDATNDSVAKKSNEKDTVEKSGDGAKDQTATLDKQMDDLEDASLDGLNDGDALGLLAETEGRERHSSDPDDDDDEAENSDRESMDETSDMDADDETESDTTDDEYQPQFDDEEDDDEIDEEDEDGHIFRATKTPVSDLQDESTQENDDLPLTADQEADEETAEEAREESMDVDDAINEDMLSISNVTSLATVDKVGLEFFQDTDDLLEKEGDVPGLVITSICSVNKTTIDKIASFEETATVKKEPTEEVILKKRKLREMASSDTVAMETVDSVQKVTDEKNDSVEARTVDETCPVEKDSAEVGELKTLETEVSEEMEIEQQETAKELESVDVNVMEKDTAPETESARMETIKESELIEKITMGAVEPVEKEAILRRTSFEKEPSDDELLKNKTLEILPETTVTNKEVEKVSTLETKVVDEMKDAVSAINEVVDNDVCKDDKVEETIPRVSETPKDTSDLPKDAADIPKDVSDEVQDIWNSLLESELPMDSGRNKRKADESLEKVAKKLDTKKVSDSDDSLSGEVSKEMEVAKDIDEAVFPAPDVLNDIISQGKNKEVTLPVDILSAIERLETGLDNVADDEAESAVVKEEPVTKEEPIAQEEPVAEEESVTHAEHEKMKDSAAAEVEKSPTAASRTSRLEIAKNVTDKMMNIVDLEESSSDADDNVDPIEDFASAASPVRSPEIEIKKEIDDAEKTTESLPPPPVDDTTVLQKGNEAEAAGDLLKEPSQVEAPKEADVPGGTQPDILLVPPPDSEVFNLSSDEEDVAPKKTAAAEVPAVPEIPPPVLDKSSCLNPTCSKWGSSLQPCPLFLPSLYRARDLKKPPLACEECLDRGVKLMEVLTTRLKTGHCLFDVEMPNNGDMVEISDSDSDDEGTASKAGKHKEGTPLLSPSEVAFLKDNLPEVFSETWHKYRVTNQLTMCENSLRMEMEELDAQARELGIMIDAEQDELDRMRKFLYETFRPPTECRKEVMITENGDTQIEINLMVERRSARVKKPVVYDEHVRESPIRTADGVVNDTTLQDAATLKNKADLPPQGALPDQPLKVGDLIFAVKQSIFGAWCPAKILQILPKGTPLANGTLSLFSLVRVRFTQLTLGEATRVIKQVTGRQLAYPEPAPVRYTIGTRVIALFKNQKQPKSAYYSGVVAEVPLRTNRYRYLVFFDDGYARYVPHADVLLVCERSARVWEDVHPDSRDFVRKYLQGYPDQPMVRVEFGHSIRAEYNGKFWFAHVMAVDSSLALIKFSESSGAPVTREEWIYRGSTRLEPLFLELQAADRKAQGRHRASYATTNPSKNRNFPYVEYSRPEQGEEAADVQVVEALPPPEESTESTPQQESQQESRSVARKSTARPDQVVPSDKVDQPPTHQLHADQVKSKVVYYSPKVSIKPAKLVPHTCGPDCLNKDALPLRDLRTYNPLARPLLSGWQRLILKYRGKRTIVYRAPCGRRLRSAQELHLYLRLTSSQMSVDLFDFDHWVHCLAEFVPTKCFVSKRDLSHGVEAVPVPCVNYYDHSLPEFSSYSTRRIPTQGVHLNLDEEFLCGCDCTDDCQDKTRCQCWQLTLEGAQLVCSQPDRVGYQYKRLLDPVPTGIYECNSRCKCAATCLNRVVQHPLQLKLQVFKTFNRGWGIRALNDVSRGTFLCIYAGNLLTDAVANVDGVNEGDEYLAELDYIEVAEKLKENYESDVPDEDKEDSKSDSEDDVAQRPLTNRDGKTGAHGESDEEFTPGTYIRKGNPEDDSIRMRTRRQLKKKDKEEESTKKSKVTQKDKEEKEKTVPDKQKETSEKPKENPSEVKKAAGTADRQSKDSDITITDGVAPVVDEFITISDDEENMREPSRFAAPEGLNDDEYVPKHRSVRSYFGKDEACYIMDAKVQGNLGRYLNHSCSPNVFVQNVFVDTHDPRFPWVAFFTLNHVRAGTELTWNYNYDVGSVPGKALYCGCGASNCRGRLL